MHSTPLFSELHQEKNPLHSPLAYQLAPQNFDEVIGQQHLVGRDKPLRRLIEKDTVSSMVLWGPPGCGKTSLAKLIATHTASQFIALNAVSAKLSDINQAKEKAKQLAGTKKTLLFIDEIHRFSKTQQDALLPDVENGLFILIGATTENPYYSVNPSLLSRCQVFELQPLSETELLAVLSNTLAFLKTPFQLDEEAKLVLCHLAAGDARKLIGLIELAHQTFSTQESVTAEDIQSLGQGQAVAINEDQHYDMISAFIKSLRGSDADAALYWMARLLMGGEDPKFIARRMVIFASEDIGNADPQALVVATALIQAVQFIGMPEIRINLAQVVTYLATAPKSNASYTAIDAAMTHIKNGHLYAVPKHLKTKAYKYPHNYPFAIVKQAYTSEKNPVFYTPKDIGFEKTILSRQEFIKKQLGDTLSQP